MSWKPTSNRSRACFWGCFSSPSGRGINFPLLFSNAPAILSMAVLVIFIKGAVLWVIGRAFKLKGRDHWLFALGLAQAGEFGFVMVGFSVTQSVITPGVGDTLLLVIALSMLITPLLFITYDLISRSMKDAAVTHAPDKIDEEGPVIIAGIGRFGQIVNRLVQASGFKTVVLDNNMDTIQLMRRFGFKGFYGDPTRSDILHAAGLETARVLVVTLDDQEAAIKLVQVARKARPDLHIVARAYDRSHTYKLYQAGANDIVRELFDSSLRAGRYVLENIGLSEFEAAEAEKVFYHHDREAVKELAALWKPDVPASQNEAYVARARELQKDLETAFLAQAEERDKG